MDSRDNINIVIVILRNLIKSRIASFACFLTSGSTWANLNLWVLKWWVQSSEECRWRCFKRLKILSTWYHPSAFHTGWERTRTWPTVQPSSTGDCHSSPIWLENVQMFTFTPVLNSCMSWDQRSVQSILSSASRPSSLSGRWSRWWYGGDWWWCWWWWLVTLKLPPYSCWLLSTRSMNEESSLPSSTKALTTPLCHNQHKDQIRMIIKMIIMELKSFPKTLNFMSLWTCSEFRQI